MSTQILAETKKDVFTSTIISQEKIAENIYDLWVEAPMIAMSAEAGQFVNLYTRDRQQILPRPISICQLEQNKGHIRFVYRRGDYHTGTHNISRLKPGDKLDMVGPLGKGFSLKGKDALLIGGGMGVAPLLELAISLKETFGKKPTCVLGYRSEPLFLVEDFMKYTNLFIATEDGSAGDQGTALDVIKNLQLEAEVIYACGPKPMLKAVKDLALEKDIKAYISLEERMGCGVGACLSCVCETVDVDEHSRVKNARVCKEGPVFEAREVVL